jgi:subtilisin family serine protease
LFNRKLKGSIVLVLSILLVLSSLSISALASNGKNKKVTEESEPAAEKFIVVFNSESLPSDYQDIITQAGGTVIYEVPQIGVIEVSTTSTTDFVKGILANKEVLSIAPSMEYSLDLPELDVDSAEVTSDLETVPVHESIWESGWQWDIEKVTNNFASHDVHRASSDVVVAVIDTGFDFNHPDLKDNVDLEGSKTFVPGTTDSWDNHSHGTHVAGTIGADGRMKGVAPGVTLRSYRVFNRGGAYQSWITKAMVTAADDGVDVINMSLGGMRFLGVWTYTDPDTGETIYFNTSDSHAASFVAYQRAVQYAINRNVTVVTSAGNSAQDLSNPAKIGEWYDSLLKNSAYGFTGAALFVPAENAGVITVSATGGGFGTEDRLAFFSNYGNGGIELGAPGGDIGPDGYVPAAEREPGWFKYLILSTVPTYMESITAEKIFGEQGYGWKAGTSMAAPQVSGAAAAYISKVYTSTGKKPKPSQVQTHLQQTAEDAGRVGYDEYYGHGIVNSYKSLTR